MAPAKAGQPDTPAIAEKKPGIGLLGARYETGRNPTGSKPDEILAAVNWTKSYGSYETGGIICPAHIPVKVPCMANCD
jgi:hypothetical protein